MKKIKKDDENELQFAGEMKLRGIAVFYIA